MSGVSPIGAPTAEPGRKQRGALAGKLQSPKTILGLLIVALAVWFVLANNSHTRIHLWVAWVSAKLWIVLAVTFLAGMLSGYLLRRRGDREKRRG
jgi:membrane protease YdiL (CAAX protease family)